MDHIEEPIGSDERAALARLGLGHRMNVSTPTSDPAAFEDNDIDRPLDPNDPMDRAILARLQERESDPAAPPAETVQAVRPAIATVRNVKPAGFGRRKAQV